MGEGMMHKECPELINYKNRSVFSIQMANNWIGCILAGGAMAC